MANGEPPLRQHETGGRAPAISNLVHRIGQVLTRHRFALGYGLIVISSLLLTPALSNSSLGDTKLYQDITRDLLQGKLPYRDRVLEYPPYVIPILVLPRIFGNDNFIEAFKLMVFLTDLVIKFLLLMVGLRHSKLLRGLLPLLFYAFAIPFIGLLYLRRYDAWPALICLTVVWLFSSKRHLLAGLALAAGIGVKVYPAVFAPTLFMLAVGQGRGRRFVVGVAAGLTPIAALGIFLPWWRFAQFQGARGLQVESLYSSALWMLERMGLLRAQWAWDKAWYELHGYWPSAILPWARGLFVSTVVLAVLMSTWAAAKCEKPSVGKVARLLLVPLLAFVCFNTVFSPQFMIWLLPLAALASLEGNPWPMIAVPFATALTPIFFPCHEYYTGLNLFETSTLLSRNLILIALWVYLMSESFQIVRRGKQTIC